METFDHDGLTLAYRDVGAGPAVVMIHNGGTSSTIWRHQVDALADRHRVVAVDLPGFGRSPRPAAPVGLERMVDAVAALIEAEGLAPALLVGNCMGTNIAATVARRRPAAVTGILAVNPLTEASFSGGRIGLLHRMGHVVPGPTRLARSLSRHIRSPRPLAAASLRFQLGDKGMARRLHHDPELLACQVRSDQMPALVDVLDDMDAYGQLDRHGVPAGVPVWICWGEQNRVLSRRRAAHLDEVMGAERVEVLDGCGHLPMLEDPDAVTGLIEALIERVAPTTTTTGAEATARKEQP